MWNKVMQKIVSSHSVENFTPPNPITGRSPALMGQLPAEDINTILYYVDRNNPLGPQPQNASSDPQYPLWQIGINNWLIRSGKYAELLNNNQQTSASSPGETIDNTASNP
jgi:hypothetical protein